ncbi:MAG: PD-(D/E)XK nuclease family protein, partial [Prevotellaceae bacterium]|nr:PD-(D/E)XK nuclease family protein [Prevotellaceae bacterium]
FPLYEEFRRELSDMGIAYEGMIYREVAEKLRATSYNLQENQRFVFVGFNALTRSEKILFKELKKSNLADFYWDYDSAQIQDEKNLASRFVKENLLEFPSKYNIAGADLQSVPSSPKIELIGIPSTVGQAKEVHRILAGMNLNEDDFLRTAVVLTDEKMLLPMLHSFPETIEAVNITMGYPLSATSAASFVEQLFDLQRSVRTKSEQSSFYHIETLALLHHQYLTKTIDTKLFAEEIKQNKKLFIETESFAENELLKTIFSPQKTVTQMADYLLDVLGLIAPKQERLDREFLYHYYNAIKRIKDLLTARKVEMNLETFARLVKRLTSMVSIPFEGEPLAGLQVMGVLETRALDFENLIITSFNEGIFPKRSASPSFIPYNLRKGFGLPTTEHQDAIFAYHFYRLAQRAKRIFLIYDTRTEGLQSGEVSRYIHQLKYHYRVPIEEKLLTADISMKPPQTLQMEKSAEVMRKLLRYSDPKTDNALSASAINTYLDCPLKFYFQYLENLRESKELTENLEASDFGNIFHKTMENFYQSFEKKIVTKEALQELLKTPVYVEKCLYNAYINVMFNDKFSGELTGQNLLFASVIKKYVLKMLEIDVRYAPFVYESSEYKTHCSIDIFDSLKIKIKGSIDRIDRKNDTVRLVDYKTGKDKSGSWDKRNFRDIESIFDPENADRPNEILQVFLYAYSYFQETKETKILPNVIFVRNMFKDDLNFGLQQKEEKKLTQVTDFLPFLKEYEQSLKKCLEEIFNPDIPFAQTAVKKHCEYCPFKAICGKP